MVYLIIMKSKVDLAKFGINEKEGKFFEEAVYSTALIYNICNTRINHYLKQFNLNVGKLNVLVAIRHHGGEDGLSQVEISKHLIVTPSNMTKLLDKLEKEELVTRSPMQGDRRINIVRVTHKAKKLLDHVWPEYSGILKELMGNISKKDQERTAYYLKNWLHELEV